MRRARPAPAIATALATVAAALAGGCGGGSQAHVQAAPYFSEPRTREQVLVERGARLVVADGCAACHLASSARSAAPRFEGLVGRRVTLASGRSVLVDEAQIVAALTDPRVVAVAGYDPAGMIRSVARAHLDRDEIAALAAFIEQVAPY